MTERGLHVVHGIDDCLRAVIDRRDATDPGSSALMIGSRSLTLLATATTFDPAWRLTATTTVAAGSPYPRTQNLILIRSSCTVSSTFATSWRYTGAPLVLLTIRFPYACAVVQVGHWAGASAVRAAPSNCPAPV